MVMTVDGEPIDYSGLPEHMRDGMQRYIEYRVPPGSFMLAVLSNDLIGAAQLADAINRHLLWDYVNWLYNHAPPNCFGSTARVVAWLKGPK